MSIGSRVKRFLPKSLSSWPQAIFASAMVLLVVCLITIYLSFSYLREANDWVIHTQEVRGALGDLEADLNHAARARFSYLMGGNDADLEDYKRALPKIPAEVNEVIRLTQDSAAQSERGKQLQIVINDRIRAWELSIAQKQAGKAVDLRALLAQNLDLSARNAAVMEAIRTEEGNLLGPRIRAARRSFVMTSLMVGVTFVVALAFLSVYYGLLSRQLDAREAAEQQARDAYDREAVARREAEDFKLFIGAVKDYAIFTLDASGHIQNWNEGAQRLKGYAAAEIVGQHFSRFYPEVDIKNGKPQRALETAAREGRVEDEGWRVRKDGSRFWANVVMTAMRNESGQLVGFTKVTRDFTERMRAQQELQRANALLTTQISERAAAEEKLAISEQSLRKLSLHLLSTQDEERKRIGRELHDSLGQYLAILKMSLDSLYSGAGRNGAREDVERCIRLADDSLKEVRTISYLLYPPMLEEMGLKSAIPWYLDGFSQRSRIQVTFDADPNFERLAPEAELALFRVLQESLTNVHRHSGSSTATVSLCTAHDKVVLEIRDKGKGIPEHLLEQAGEDWMGSLGVGLRGMNERLRQLGGKLEITSTALGTTVTASVPTASHVALADSA